MKGISIHFTICSIFFTFSAFAQVAPAPVTTQNGAKTPDAQKPEVGTGAVADAQKPVTPEPTLTKKEPAKLGPSLLPGVAPTLEDYRSRFALNLDIAPGVNLLRGDGTQGGMEGNFVGTYDLLDSCRAYKDKSCIQLQPFANIAIGGYFPSGSFFLQSGIGVGGRFYFGDNRKVAFTLHFSPIGAKAATATSAQVAGAYYYLWVQPAAELNLGKMIDSPSAQGWKLRFGAKLGWGAGSPGQTLDIAPTLGFSYQFHS